MLSPHKHLVQDCPTKKVLDNLSLETQPTKKSFADSIQKNMSKCIKNMNPETKLISTGLSAQSPLDLNITSREDMFLKAY